MILYEWTSFWRHLDGLGWYGIGWTKINTSKLRRMPPRGLRSWFAAHLHCPEQLVMAAYCFWCSCFEPFLHYVTILHNAFATSIPKTKMIEIRLLLPLLRHASFCFNYLLYSPTIFITYHSCRFPHLQDLLQELREWRQIRQTTGNWEF